MPHSAGSNPAEGTWDAKNGGVPRQEDPANFDPPVRVREQRGCPARRKRGPPHPARRETKIARSATPPGSGLPVAGDAVAVAVQAPPVAGFTPVDGGRSRSTRLVAVGVVHVLRRRRRRWGRRRRRGRGRRGFPRRGRARLDLDPRRRGRGHGGRGRRAGGRGGHGPWCFGPLGAADVRPAAPEREQGGDGDKSEARHSIDVHGVGVCPRQRRGYHRRSVETVSPGRCRRSSVWSERCPCKAMVAGSNPAVGSQ